MVKSMDPKTGRCTVILPQGVLFHAGKEGEIRKLLVESDKLECVITLVGGLFYGAGVSACILYLNNNKPADRKGKVCLVDATGIYTAARAQNYMSETDVEMAYQLYANFEDVVDRVKVVTLEEIKEKGYTLSVNNYIDKTIMELNGFYPLINRNAHVILRCNGQSIFDGRLKSIPDEYDHRIIAYFSMNDNGVITFDLQEANA